MEMESTCWAREKSMRKDTEKRKYGVVQELLSSPFGKGRSHRTTFSEGALLGKGLMHGEGQSKGPQASWVRDPYQYPLKGHTLLKTGTVYWKRPTALGWISNSAAKCLCDFRHSLNSLILRTPSVKRGE